MVRMGRARKPGMAAFYNATAENPNPLAVAGPFVAGQRGAGAGQLCEAAVRAYGAAMGSVCTCSRCKEWDLQQDPVRAVHNFYSDTNPGVSEACDTNKTTPSCVCQPGSKVYYRVCVRESAVLVPRPSPPTPAYSKTLITVCVLRSAGHACVCQPGSNVYYREFCESAVLVLIQPRSTVFSPG